MRETMRNYRILWAIPNIRWLVMIRFLGQISFFTTVVVAFERSRGLDYAGMFWLESILSGAIFLFQIPSGFLAERIGYRRMLLLGQGLLLASHVVFALAYGFGLFVLSAVLFGLGMAAISGCDEAILYESLPDAQRQELGSGAFALVHAAASGGLFSGLLLGSLMAIRSPAVPVYATLVPVTLAWAAVFGLHSTGAGRGQGLPAPSIGMLVMGVMRLLRGERRAIGLSLFGASAFTLINAIFWFNQPFFERAAIPVLVFGPLTAVAVALQMVVALAAPVAARRLGQRAAMALSVLLPGGAFLALRLVTGPAGTILLVTLVIAGSAWRAPLLSEMINRRIPDGARATALSSLSFVGGLAGMVLNPVIGLAGDAGLGVTSIALGAGLVVLACVAMVLCAGD